MTLNASGPISLAGSTTGQSIAVELGLGATTAISLNQAAVRTLAAVPSGAIVMPTNFYGKSNRVTATATISANTTNYTVNTAKASGYASGTTDFTLTINSGIFVSSTSTGSYAMTVDSSWAAGDTVTIVNNGTIIGRGGNGGTGSNGGGFPGNGNSAGPALNVNRAITFNNTSGRIAGGGGGGGGGMSKETFPTPKTTLMNSGNGGGGGIGNSTGGNGGSGASNGSPGSLTSAGAGGTSAGGSGGAGGSFGSVGLAGENTPQGPGGSGGAAGACIVGNSNITYAGTGTRNGSIS